MIIALSSSTRYLAGVAVLSAGLAVVALYLLMTYRTREKRTQRAARDAFSSVYPALQFRPGEPSVADLVQRAEKTIRDLQEARPPKGLSRQLHEAKMLLKTVQGRTEVLEEAHETALDLSVEELGYLNKEEELSIANLLALVQAGDRLQEEISNRRRLRSS